MLVDLLADTPRDVPRVYRLLTSGVVPRPIAWVSTRSAEGVDNLAPYSFFTVASVQPPTLLHGQRIAKLRDADGSEFSVSG